MISLPFATQEAIQPTGAKEGRENFSSGYLSPLENYEAPKVLEQVGECGIMWEMGPLEEGKISCKAIFK